MKELVLFLLALVVVVVALVVMAVAVDVFVVLFLFCGVVYIIFGAHTLCYAVEKRTPSAHTVPTGRSYVSRISYYGVFCNAERPASNGRIRFCCNAGPGSRMKSKCPQQRFMMPTTTAAFF